MEAKLERFLDEQELARAHGISLESVYRAARSVADGLIELEKREQIWREELRRDLLSMAVRMRNVEADIAALDLRMAAIEQQLRRST